MPQFGLVVAGMKYIASISFGKDSLAMLLKLIENQEHIDSVVFYDTGMEFDAIYKTRDQVLPLLDYHNINFVTLRPKEPFLYSMLERKVKYRNKDGFHYGYEWCGGSCRWGTTAKLRAIQSYKKSLNDYVVDYVGIAADESSRFCKAQQEGKILPLVDYNMTESDCLQFCYDKGYSWNENGVRLYDVLDRVSCWCCRNKNLKELYNIYRYLPTYWNKLKELQLQISTPFKGNGKSIFELEERFKTYGG